MGERVAVTRRTVLAGGAAAVASVVVGCTSDNARPSPSAASGPTTPATATGSGAPATDFDLVSAALADEQSVLAAYSATARANRRLRAPLAPLIDIQRRHVGALADALGLDGPAARPPAAPPELPPEKLVTHLARVSHRRRLKDCRHAESGSLAALLASMAASHQVAAHVWARR